MKKIVVMLLCISCPKCFALPPSISAGGGNALGAEFRSYSWNDIAQSGVFVNTGGFGFFDFQYGEVSLSLLSGFGTVDYFTGSKFAVNVDLLAKYPFGVIQNITVYPLAGLSTGYDFSVGFNLTICAGIGVDWHFTESLFLRCEAIYSFACLTELTAADKQFAADNGFDYAASNHGVFVRAGVGYRIRQ